MKSKRFAQVAVGGTFTYALTHDGDLFGWGKDFLKYGDKVQSNEPVPIEIPEGKKIVSVSAGLKHCAAIDVDGQVYTWGEGGSWYSGGGQLGHGSRSAEPFPKLVQSFRQYGALARQVSCGGSHTLLLTHELEVLSCGVGEYGRLGTGSKVDALQPTPLTLLADDDILQVAAGFDHSLALSRAGRIYSWGRNHLGQLGHSDSNLDLYSLEDLPRIVETNTLADEEQQDRHVELVFRQIAAGNGRSAAVTSEGELFVWGNRLAHQPKRFPSSLFGGQKVLQVAIGGDSSRSAVAVVTENGELWTFGDSKSCILGKKGLSGKQPLPLHVELKNSDDRVLSVASGLGQHMAAFVHMPNES